MRLFRKIKTLKDIIFRLWTIVDARQKRIGIVIFVMTVFGAVLQAVGISALIPLMTLIITPDKTSDNGIFFVVQSFFSLENREEMVIFFSIGVALFYILKNLYMSLYTWAYKKYSCYIEREISVRIITSLMYRPYDFFLDYGIAQIERDVHSDPGGIYSLIGAIFSVASELLTSFAIVIVVVISEWRVALFIIILAIINMYINYRVFRRIVLEQGEAVRQKTALHQNVFLQMIGGVKEVQVMRKQDYYLKAYEVTYLDKQKPAIAEAVASIVPSYLIEAVFVMGIMMYFCIIGARHDNLIETMPYLSAYAVGIIRMLPSLGRISSSMNTIIYQSAALNSAYDTIERTKQYDGLTTAEVNDKTLLLPEGHKTLFNETLSLKNVSWKYRGSETNVLENVNLDIQKGESVAIIGKSGAGKTTLADIILGLHIPQEGFVTVDGIDIHSIPEDWSRLIGYVPQTIYLINGSVRENVAFGTPREEIDNQRVKKALEMAQLSDVIGEMPDGIDTEIGDRGVKISGGQRQRLAIARALYREPQILVLDEATSALDDETESVLMETIESLYGKMTIIVIAHRLSTTKNCDRVYRITDGKAIAE